MRKSKQSIHHISSTRYLDLFPACCPETSKQASKIKTVYLFLAYVLSFVCRETERERERESNNAKSTTTAASLSIQTGNIRICQKERQIERKREKEESKLRLHSSLAPNPLEFDRSPIKHPQKCDKEAVPKMQALSPVEVLRQLAAEKVKYSRKFL